MASEGYAPLLLGVFPVQAGWSAVVMEHVTAREVGTEVDCVAVFEACHFMHSKDFVHGDLRDLNVKVGISGARCCPPSVSALTRVPSVFACFLGLSTHSPVGLRIRVRGCVLAVFLDSHKHRQGGDL